MDGGVRQGTDVLKALALGAKAVFIGRPVVWGLAHSVSWFTSWFMSHGVCMCMPYSPPLFLGVFRVRKEWKEFCRY